MSKKKKDVEIHSAAEILDNNPAFAKEHNYAFTHYAVEENGTFHGFWSENDACLFQKCYRAANGLNPHTGE